LRFFPFTLALAGLALTGCAHSSGDLIKNSPTIFNALNQSVADANTICERDLRGDAIYPQTWPAARGLSAERQRDRYYQQCMARHEHPEAAFAPPAPPLGPLDEQALKLMRSIQESSKAK
jgi:hypothetical protein